MRIAKKAGNLYIVFDRPGEHQKWISVRKELGLNRPAKMKEARALMTRLESERLHGIFIEPNKVTVKQYLTEWLSTQKPRVKPKTYEYWSGAVNNHLIPTLGDIPLSQLRPGKLKSIYAEKLKAGRKDGKDGGLSPRTVQIMHAVLKRALQSALEDEIVRRNVAAGITPPRQQDPRVIYWTREQAKCFLDYTSCGSKIKKIPYPEHHYHTLFALALATGMRRGELLGLRWSDIDFKKKMIYVRQNLVLTDEGIIIQDTTKTGKDRSFEVSQKVLDMLKIHRQRQAQMIMALGRPVEALNLVFLSQRGTPVHPRRLDRCLKGLIKKLNKQLENEAKKAKVEASLLPVISMHCLRHTYATMMIEQGMDYNTLADRLGHARPSITMDKYGHVTPKMQSRAATMTDDLL